MSAKKKEKVETKKKEVVSKKVEKLPREKQRILKTLSKIICVISKILKVCAVIVAAFMLLCVVFTPVLVKNVKIEDNVITVFDTKLEYKYDDEGVDLYVGEVLIGRLNNDEKVEFDILVNEVARADVTKSFAFIELALIAGVAVVFLTYFILRYVDMLFANIAKNETPFTDDNVDYLSKISYLTMITVIISIVSDIISSLLFDNSLVKVNLSNAIVVLVLYVITYIFEYACILQKESKNKLYSE